MVIGIFGGQSVLSVSESVCTDQRSTEFRTPLCNAGYAPVIL